MPSLTAPQQVSRPVRLAAQAIVLVTLAASSALGSYLIASGSVMDMTRLPQPIGWIAQILVIESWPTFREVQEIRWFAWAIGTLALVMLAAATGRRTTTPPSGQKVLILLAGLATVLVALVALRALFSAVPSVGLAWTWQLALGLLWMLVICWWALRVPPEALARPIALALAVVAAVSLLFCLQVWRPYPNWPTGNVLLLTTACLAGVFLLGTWAYQRLAGPRGAEPWAFAAGLAVSSLLVVVTTALSMSGRRAGLLGLAAGGLFMLLVVYVRGRRAKLAAAGLLLAGTIVASVAAPHLLTTGRWQTVVFRAETYRQTLATFLDRSSTMWLGIGPGHLGFELTPRMRPFNAESPRLYHGDIADQAHSEPLQALAELGLPLALFYLALPAGGLVGLAVAYRRTADGPGRAAMLGLGAALAAVLAAEATSVGMRHAGVMALAWGIAGIGWACGARAGAFDGLLRRLRLPLQPEPVRGRQTLVAGAAGAMAVTVLIAAALAFRAGGHLHQGQAAMGQGRLEQADAHLDRAGWQIGGGEWMVWRYMQGRLNVERTRQGSLPEQIAAPRAKAQHIFEQLVSACPAYQDAPVWLGRTRGDWDVLREQCHRLLQYDPYNAEARLAQAADPAADAVERLEALRLALRNTCVDPGIARMLAQAADDPASLPVLQQWLADADSALRQPDTLQWTDPFALESLRVAIVLHGRRGEIAEALDLANKAATLSGYLAADVRQQRLETVEMEVALNQAWFGWLVRPEAAPTRLALLEGQIEQLVQGPAESSSERMAAQLAAMLWLAQGRPGEAARDLLISQGPGASRAVLQQLTGLAYARLVTLVAASPDTQAWEAHGRRLLGEQAWSKALQAWRAQPASAWWQGVLVPE